MRNKSFDEASALHRLKHFLPSQNALKDFVHHNTLHALQDQSFFTALQMGTDIFGYQTTYPIATYQQKHQEGIIRDEIIDKVVAMDTSKLIPMGERKSRMLNFKPASTYQAERVGRLRKEWLSILRFDLDTIVTHSLFKYISSYLDQGISAYEYRSAREGFLDSIRHIADNSYFQIVKSKHAKALLHDPNTTLTQLLDHIVGDPAYYEQYLFDQQMAHPGWSGMVAVVEQHPDMLFDQRSITLEEFIKFELILEIDALESKMKEWKTVADLVQSPPIDLFAVPATNEEWLIRKWWQESLEMSYFDEVLHGLTPRDRGDAPPKFQAYFCIDDREESLRRWIEHVEPEGETKGSPAHYNLLIKYRPKGGKFNAHVCPGPAKPKHIILDEAQSEEVGKDLHYHQSSHSLFSGWLISQTLGLYSAFKLFVNIFKPSISPGHSSALEHMSHKASPLYENEDGEQFDEYQVGFTLDEMIDIVSAELRRTGTTKQFAPLIYFFGHGGSSTNNPYYAGYNCGACSGRPSSLNARLFAKMGNRSDVREGLRNLGIHLPDTSQFVGGLHDTTRDEIVYYDIDALSEANQALHRELKVSFDKALDMNAKERARNFLRTDTSLDAAKVHEEVRLRSVSLFEPRPELNHSNNCLCIVGRRTMSQHLFLDQRAFLNSYDYRLDPEGELLTPILQAATPVCGGINLEYYFSKMDNERFGAGSKLPHNVVGLFGVANGVEGDLRTGLPTQMIDLHESLRLMMIIEHHVDVVQDVLDANPAIKEWYDNEWLKLAVVDPHSGEKHLYVNGEFKAYTTATAQLQTLSNPESVAQVRTGNTPVFKIV